MAEYGYFLACEEHGPRALAEQARMGGLEVPAEAPSRWALDDSPDT